MAETVIARIWLGRLIFASCAAIILFVGLVPLGFTPRFLPQPDLLLCLTLAFTLRRPDFVPVWLLATVFLLSDILLMRPPGLWTAIVILLVEFSRAQEYRFRELVFPFEWAYVSGAIFLALIANRLILSLTMVPQPGFGSIMLHFLLTALVYPFVVFFCYSLLRIHKVTPDEAIRYGHRL